MKIQIEYSLFLLIKWLMYVFILAGIYTSSKFILGTRSMQKESDQKPITANMVLTAIAKDADNEIAWSNTAGEVIEPGINISNGINKYLDDSRNINTLHHAFESVSPSDIQRTLNVADAIAKAQGYGNQTMAIVRKVFQLRAEKISDQNARHMEIKNRLTQMPYVIGGTIGIIFLSLLMLMLLAIEKNTRGFTTKKMQ